LGVVVRHRSEGEEAVALELCGGEIGNVASRKVGGSTTRSVVGEGGKIGGVIGIYLFVKDNMVRDVNTTGWNVKIFVTHILAILKKNTRDRPEVHFVSIVGSKVGPTLTTKNLEEIKIRRFEGDLKGLTDEGNLLIK
jgi:hypothetical protein